MECKKINVDGEGHDVKAKFSWWSPKFGGDNIKLVRSTLRTAIAPFLDEHDRPSDLELNFACSDAFLARSSRCGGYDFQYNINDLLQHCKDFFRDTVQGKVLGTFGYEAEVIHAVLVCSQENGDGLFKEYPLVLHARGRC